MQRLLVTASALVLVTTVASLGDLPDDPPNEEPAVRIVESVLRDRIDSDGTLLRSQSQTVDLLSAAGVEAYRQIGVPFFEANQQARIHGLVVIDTEGREVDLSASAPRDVAPVFPLNLPIYSDLRILRAAVPMLEVGDRLRFSTSVTVEPLAGAGAWTEMKFLDPREADRQVYELDAPADSSLVVHVRAGFRAELEEIRSEGRWIRRWTLLGEDHSEAGATETIAEGARIEERRNTPEIQVSSFSTWDELASWWASLAAPKVDTAVRAKADELTRDKEQPLARLAALHRFVAQEVRYLALPLGIGRYQAREPEEVLRTRLGDCKDKIRLLASLGEAVGLRIDPVLVFASARRELVEAPSPLQFDHVIGRARIDGQEIWLDPTSEMTRFGRLPASLRDLAGLAITPWRSGASRPGSGQLPLAEVVATPDDRAPSELRSQATGSIDREGLVTATVRTTIDGDEERVRLLFKYGDERARRALAVALQHGWGESVTTRAIRFSDPSRLDEPFWFEADFEWQAGGSIWRAGRGLVLPAGGVSIESPDAAPRDARGDPPERLELEEPERQLVSARFELPEGVSASSPVPVAMERDFARFRSSYRAKGRVLELERELVRTTDAVTRDRFAELESFARLVEQDAQQEFDLAVPSELARSPETADELDEACSAATEGERYEEAARLCGRLTELDPHHGDAWNLLGIALESLNRVTEAKAAYRRQIDVDPQHAVAYANLGRLDWSTGELASAERLLRKQIDAAPLEAFAHGLLGELLVQQGRLDEGEPLLRRALRLDASDSRVVSALLLVEAQRGRYPSFATLAGEHPEALTDPHSFPFLVYLLTQDLEGEALATSSIIEDGVRATAAALAGSVAIPPSEESIRAVYVLSAVWELRARAALQRGDLDQARSLFDAALRLAHSPSAAEGSARVRLARGDSQGAKRLLAIAVALATESKEKYERQLERAVGSADARRALLELVREETWRLQSQSRQVPGAAGKEGELWVSFAPDGRFDKAEATATGELEALLQDLRRTPMQLELPPGNRSHLVIKVLAHCTASGECTLVFEPPGQTWARLWGEAN